MIKIEQLLQRWERWIAENLPAAIDTLRPGASDEAITEFEREVGFDLPDDVRAWFRWRDGQTRYCALNVLFGPELLSLEAALSEWKMWHDFADMNEQIAESCTSRPAGAVIAAYTIPGWIPLAQWPAIGNYLGVDLSPGPQGTVGQVINFGRDEEEKCVGGVSLTDFLEFVIEELESGHAIIDEYGICGHSLFHIEPYAQPMHFSSVLATLHDQGEFDGRRLNVDDTKEKTEPLPPDVLDKLRRVHDAAADDRFGDVWDLLNADPSLTEHPGPYGDTLLHSTASGRSPTILEYLAQFGLDPDAKNDRGETPLMTCKASFRVTCDVREPSSKETEQYEETLEILGRMSPT